MSFFDQRIGRSVPGRSSVCVPLTSARFPIAVLVMLASAILAIPLNAQPTVTPAEGASIEVATSPVASVQPRERHALIVVGIPGDGARRRRFSKMVDSLQNWLAQRARVLPQNIKTLTPEGQWRSDADTLRKVATDLSRTIREDDSLWVFSIGHGSIDKRAGWFHLPGPDLNDTQWANLFTEVQAKEQVYWFTHSGSGRFIKSFSRPGRIVITATDPEEVNETRFPLVLADLLDEHAGRANETSAPDGTDQSTRLSVLDLFRSVSDSVESVYQSESLVPTEHAQLDDNGDGLGTEALDLNTEVETIDGGLANRVIIQLRRPHENESVPNETSAPEPHTGVPAP